MQLKYTGDAGTRTVGEYHWVRDGITEVKDDELVKVLLVEGDFVEVKTPAPESATFSERIVPKQKLGGTHG